MTGNLLNEYRKLSSLHDLELATHLGYLSDDVIIINKFARADLSNGNVELAASFPNIDPYLLTPTNVYLTSTNTNDNFDVMVRYIDHNYDMQDVIITLNGQSSVLIGNDIRCIWRMENDSDIDQQGEIFASTELNPSGGLPANNGITGSSVYCHMPLTSDIAANQSLSSVFTIPRNYTAIIYSPISESSKGVDCLAAGFARQDGKTFKYKLGMSSYESTSAHSNFMTKIPEKTDLKIIAIAQTGGIVYFEYNIMLIKNNALNIKPD